MKEIMNSHKISQVELAESMDIMQQTVNAWFARGSVPKGRYDSVISHINELASRDEVKLVTAPHIKPFVKNSDNIDSIKLYDMRACAGTGFNIDSVEEMPFSNLNIDRSILPSHIMSSDVVAMRIDGKSMIPTILPDEIVIYKEEIGKYSGDALYIVNYGGMLMVKRIQFNPELGKFDIISDNPQFKSYSVDLTDDQTTLSIIGKIIATIQQ